MPKHTVYFVMISPKNLKELGRCSNVLEAKQRLSFHPRNTLLFQVTDGDRQKVFLSKKEVEKIWNRR